MFFSTFFITHYVSLGSILLYVALVICSVVFRITDFYGWSAAGAGMNYTEYITVIILLTILMLIRHKENIKRLFAGCERRTYLRSDPEIDVK